MGRKLKIYLSHAIERMQEGRFLKMFLEHVFRDGIEIFNPFHYQGSIRERWVSGERTKSIADMIMRKDLELIRDSDLIIAYITGNESIGTSMEIFFARFVIDKPVIVLILEDHPWLLSLGACRVMSVEQLIQEVRKHVENKK